MEALGSYVEPFFGSGAVLAARPHVISPRTHVELVNDLNGWLVNAWRSVQWDPDGVMYWLGTLSYSEGDLRAAKKYVYARDLSEQLQDIDFYDVRMGAYWLAVMSGFVGNGGASNNAAGSLSLNPRQGIYCVGEGELKSWSTRFSDVRILAGDWFRCVRSDSSIYKHWSTNVGVYLDPPYADGSNTTYGAAHTDEPAIKAAEWAIAHGDDPQMRIIYSGCEGTVEFPDTWRVVEWETSGGYANKATKGDGAGKENAKRERLWLSPHCLADRQPELF